jgi:hypothetical protein
LWNNKSFINTPKSTRSGVVNDFFPKNKVFRS